MTDAKAPPPNTYVVEVSWWDMLWWGSSLWLAQEMVGMSGPRKSGSNNDLDTKKFAVDDLREYFEEIELEGKRLGLVVYMDQDWHGTAVSTIETSLPYGAELTDEIFLSIVNDYVAYMHSLPLADPAQAITEEEREKGMREANSLILEDMLKGPPELLKMYLIKDMEAARERRENPLRDIEF